MGELLLLKLNFHDSNSYGAMFETLIPISGTFIYEYFYSNTSNLTAKENIALKPVKIVQSPQVALSWHGGIRPKPPP